MSTQDDDEYRVVRRRRSDTRSRARYLRGAAVVVATAVLGVVALALAVGAFSGASAPVRTAAHAVASEDATPGATTPTTRASKTTSTTAVPPPTIPPDQVLPESGSGRRTVFSVGRQRMWWVDDAGTVLRTSPVSGRPNTPSTGTFQVYSKTLNATGLDGSRMDYFVRFTKGPNGWAIGFHDIPIKDGAPVQTEEQLGQPLSHGCIRQREADATFTWDFLEVGDTVVVVA